MFTLPIGCALVALLLPGIANALVDVMQTPDKVHVAAESATADQSDSPLAHVVATPQADGLHIRLSAPGQAIKSISLHWSGNLNADTRCLGDAWERAYADLGWRPLADSGVMPWYFLANAGDRTDGYGVMTRPGAMCHWTADATGITLVADVRSGGVGVELGDRTLDGPWLARAIITLAAA
jgi:hypothetical protein